MLSSLNPFVANIQLAIEEAQRHREEERAAEQQRQIDSADQQRRDLERTRAVQEQRRAAAQATGSTTKPDMRLRIFIKQPDGRTVIGTTLEDDPITPGRPLGYCQPGS